jgi:hypothetical protein
MIPDVVIYEHYKGRLDSGQQVLVQVFRDDHNGQVLQATIAQRNCADDLWNSPTALVAG